MKALQYSTSHSPCYSSVARQLNCEAKMFQKVGTVIPSVPLLLLKLIYNSALVQF